MNRIVKLSTLLVFSVTVFSVCNSPNAQENKRMVTALAEKLNQSTRRLVHLSYESYDNYVIHVQHSMWFDTNQSGDSLQVSYLINTINANGSSGNDRSLYSFAFSDIDSFRYVTSRGDIISDHTDIYESPHLSIVVNKQLGASIGFDLEGKKEELSEINALLAQIKQELKR